MLQLQPDIIVTRVVNHLSTSSSLESTIDNKELLVPGNMRYLQRSNLVAMQYDRWTRSSPWIRFLLGQFEYRRQQYIQRGRLGETVYAKYKLPEIFSYYQFTLWTRRSLSGLWLNWKVHRTIPIEDSFFIVVRQGNTSIVQSLLAEKKAYITDRDDYDGDTALHVSFQTVLKVIILINIIS
jgi:hypothetical protein